MARAVFARSPMLANCESSIRSFIAKGLGLTRRLLCGRSILLKYLGRMLADTRNRAGYPFVLNWLRQPERCVGVNARFQLLQPAASFGEQSERRREEEDIESDCEDIPNHEGEKQIDK